ncbi:MAG: homoserine kinase [Methylococcaceae bacterium]|jgi:homoserine kinase type II
MSVYSTVSPDQLRHFFSHYRLGDVLGYEGILDGVDNTNYLIFATTGDYVLTLFESLSADALPHYINLLQNLAKTNLPCPCLKLDKQGQSLGLLGNKQAAVFQRLFGRATLTPSVQHCHEIGWHLGRLHLQTLGYDFPMVSNHGLSWCQAVMDKLGHQLSASDQALINDELRFQAKYSAVALPTGIIHGDLFRDNALFMDNKLSGILDFYSAGQGLLLLDIAITTNDWCQEQGKLNHKKMATLLSGYEMARPLTALEKQYWPVQLRSAALRFWLSRLEYQLYPRAGAVIQQKDPQLFRQLLCQHRERLGFNAGCSG